METTVVHATKYYRNVHHVIIHVIQTSDHYVKHVMSKVSLSAKRKVVKNLHGRHIVDHVKKPMKRHINTLYGMVRTYSHYMQFRSKILNIKY